MIGSDYATMLTQLGRVLDGARAMERAANVDARNAVLASRVGDIYAMIGDSEQTQRWVDESERRRAARGDSSP